MNIIDLEARIKAVVEAEKQAADDLKQADNAVECIKSTWHVLQKERERLQLKLECLKKVMAEKNE